MELVVRNAVKEDMPDLAEISRGTWEGHDYLEKVSAGWLAESGFFVGMVDSKVAACAKITTMPGRVAWLEGLRVRSDLRGKGLGRLMSRRILDIALDGVREDTFSSIEFSTYINNIESRTLAEKQGFRITEMFHVVGSGLEVCSADELPVQAEPSMEEFEIYPEHAPCGWKYFHWRAPEAMGWLTENASFWRTPSGGAFLSSNRGFEISPLASSLEHPEEFIRGGMALAASRGIDYLEMMVYDGHRELLLSATNAGFEYWEEPGRANIPVYRHNG